MGWREDGINGYIWAVSTPTLCYYEYHHSRAGEVIKELIGEEFCGVLGSDFYAGYNSHQGLHQRMPGCISYAMCMSSKSSPKGSQTCMGFASLFGTWMAQHLNPFHQCLATLTFKTSLGQV